MVPLNMMVQYGRTDHLVHPLCEALLCHKWVTYGFPLHLIQLVFYLSFRYVQWILHISTLVFALPFLFDQSIHYQWEAGSIAIFVAWFALLFSLGR
ncbi:unnamed protein product, partial [Didymodactylos carnosus]